MSTTVATSRRLAAWAGMIGPLLFVATFTLEGWLRPGYEARGMFVSELSLGPRGWIQTVNFVVFGLLLLAFAPGVAAEFREGKASKAGPLLLAIIGVSFVASGFFAMDPVSGVRFAPPPDQVSWHAGLHGLFGSTVFSLAPVSCFVFARRFRDDPKWRSFLSWTAAAGAIVVAAVVVLVIGPAHPPAAPNLFNDWIGAIQRTVIVPYLAWLFTFATRLWSRNP